VDISGLTKANYFIVIATPATNINVFIIAFGQIHPVKGKHSVGYWLMN